jgi:glycosyltransferase involved in cell wall biosynthesis
MTTDRTPRLAIGLPVFNGSAYLAEALEALLGQTYTDFELIISDNASTDATEEICRDFASRDPRVRYIRQPRNIGAIPNHNAVFSASSTELFKWASDDDLYARDLVERCVAALDEHPEAVLAHSWTALIDATESVTEAVGYPLSTASADVGTRFRSMLFDDGGDDDYGVIRADVLRRIPPYDSYHRSDRTIIAELSLHGPFLQVPAWLFFRRVHDGSIESTRRSIRDKAVAWDPRRASRWRHPVARLLAEYVWAYISAILRAPLTLGERVACFRALISWLTSRAFRRTTRRSRGERGVWASKVDAPRPATESDAARLGLVGPIEEIVAGRGQQVS